MKKLITAISILALFIGVQAFADETEINWAPYMKDMQSRIKKNWDPPKRSESTHVTVLYTIKKDGKLGKVEILKSSNDKETDAAAIKAIKNTKFYPLPVDKNFKKDHVDVNFTFDYNVKNNQ